MLEAVSNSRLNIYLSVIAVVGGVTTLQYSRDCLVGLFRLCLPE